MLVCFGRVIQDFFLIPTEVGPCYYSMDLLILVTQGDPLSMFMYAIRTFHSFHNPEHWTQQWNADNASAGGSQKTYINGSSEFAHVVQGLVIF